MTIGKSNDFATNRHFLFHPHFYSFRIHKKRKVLEVKDIAYFESDSNYTLICLKTGKSFLSSFTLKYHIEHLGDVPYFYRISRQHFINIRFIKSKDEKYVLLKNGKQMPISRRRLKQLDELLMEIQ